MEAVFLPYNTAVCTYVFVGRREGLGTFGRGGCRSGDTAEPEEQYETRQLAAGGHRGAVEWTFLSILPPFPEGS